MPWLSQRLIPWYMITQSAKQSVSSRADVQWEGDVEWNCLISKRKEEVGCLSVILSESSEQPSWKYTPHAFELVLCFVHSWNGNLICGLLFVSNGCGNLADLNGWMRCSQSRVKMLRQAWISLPVDVSLRSFVGFGFLMKYFSRIDYYIYIYIYSVFLSRV